MKAVSYILLNVAASLAIVFSNKAVFAIFQFPYPFLLTLIHITFTAFGMRLLALVRPRQRLGALVPARSVLRHFTPAHQTHFRTQPRCSPPQSPL